MSINQEKKLIGLNFIYYFFNLLKQNLRIPSNQMKYSGLKILYCLKLASFYFIYFWWIFQITWLSNNKIIKKKTIMDPITGFYDCEKDLIALEIDMLSILEKI
jgi:hypothetical protein